MNILFKFSMKTFFKFFMLLRLLKKAILKFKVLAIKKQEKAFHARHLSKLSLFFVPCPLM